MSEPTPEQQAWAEKALRCRRVERATRALHADGVVIGGGIEVRCATHYDSDPSGRPFWPCPETVSLAQALAVRESDLAPTVAALIEAAEKRGAQRALIEAADALDTIRHDHTKATLARSAAGGIAPWLRRRAEEVG